MIQLIVLIFTLFSLGHTQRYSAQPLAQGNHEWLEVNPIQTSLGAPITWEANITFKWQGSSGDYLMSICPPCLSQTLQLIDLETQEEWIIERDLSQTQQSSNQSQFFQDMSIHLIEGHTYSMIGQGEGGYNKKFLLLEPSAFMKYMYAKLQHLYWYLGILFVFIWINFILIKTTNQEDANHYIYYLLAFALTIFSYSGLATFHLGSHAKWLLNHQYFFFLLSLLFFLRFCQTFFLRIHIKQMARGLSFLIYFAMGLHFLKLDFYFPGFVGLFAVFAILSIFVLCLLEALNHKDLYALKFICIAMSFFLISNAIGILSHLGLTGSLLGNYRHLVVIIGHSALVLTLTIYIAYRAHKEKLENLSIVREQEIFRTELMINIAHELRTPLVGLSGVAEDQNDQEKLKQIEKLVESIQQIDPRLKRGDS